MENKRIIKFGVVVSVTTGILAGIPVLLRAYEPETTHKALTQEMVLFFNHYHPALSLNTEEKALIMRGSFDEDDGIRAMHHFYDPINKKGISLGGEWINARQWAEDTLAQASNNILRAENIYGNIVSYFSADSDFSWERGVYEYAWGDKSLGLKTLGHILHLIEDMAVPDHTRNDKHPPYANSVFHQASPYEHWADKWNFQTVSVSSDLIKAKKAPVLCVSLGSCFDSIAVYSNNNFFSKDTILKDYELPVIKFEKQEFLSDNQLYTFGYYTDKFNDQFKLVKIRKATEWSDPEYFITDVDNLILSDYWNHLSKQAVLHGAGVIKLFFEEIAKEKETKLLYEKNKSWVMRRVDDAIYAYNVAQEKTITAYENASSWLAWQAGNIKQDILAVTNYVGGFFNGNNQALLFAALEPAPDNSIIATKEPSNEIANTIQFVESKLSEIAKPDILSDVILPHAITSDTGTSLTASSTATDTSAETKTSTASAQEIISQENASTTVLLPPAPIAIWGQGSSGSKYLPDDSAQNITPAGTEQEAKPIIPQDTIAPTATLEISECSRSFSPTGCVLATSTVTVAWSSPDADVAEYEISCAVNGILCAEFPYATSSSASRIINVNHGNIYDISLTVRDTAGNTAPTITKTAEINMSPVIINEIGWGGTSASFQDEYIELFNTSAFPILLAGFSLYSKTDQKPYIELRGVVPAGGYYLIERTNDETISDISADLIASFGAGAGAGLANFGEVLALAFASTTIDITPSSCFGWCYGTNTGYAMERVRPSLSGSDENNWGTNNGFIIRGRDANGGIVFGTPKFRNSLNYQVSRTSSLIENTILTEQKSPYILPFSLIVPDGKVLTAEAGTVIKILNNRSLIIDGSLRLTGSENKPIVITSFLDDEFGGDLNNDGTSTIPHRGDWDSVIFNPSSADSVIQNSIIKYGGKIWSGVPMPQALIYADSSGISVNNSVISEGQGYGIRLKNSNSSIINNTIRDIGGSIAFNSSAIHAEGGAPLIKDNTITKNDSGIILESGVKGVLENNNFINHRLYSVFAASSCPVFGINFATASPQNGIYLTGSAPADCELKSNLPFLVGGFGFKNSADTMLTLAPGTIFKFQGNNASLNIEGTIAINGSDNEKVIFTSMADDTVGGDANGDGISQGRAGDWAGVRIFGRGTSTIVSAEFKFGGFSSFGWPAAMLNIQNGAAEISKSLFVSGQRHGLSAVNLPYLKISNTDFLRHNSRPDSSGLYLENSFADLSNLIFRENQTAIASLSSVVNSAVNIDIDISNAVATSPINLLP